MEHESLYEGELSLYFKQSQESSAEKIRKSSGERRVEGLGKCKKKRKNYSVFGREKILGQVAGDGKAVGHEGPCVRGYGS